MDLADVTWSNAEMSMKSTFMMRLTYELLDNVPNYPLSCFTWSGAANLPNTNKTKMAEGSLEGVDA